MLYILLCLAVVGIPMNCTPVIETSLGKIIGYHKTSYEGRVFSAFEGIPYAKPPVGDLRFEPPEPVEPWNKVLNATTKYTCKQIDNEFTTAGNGYGVEDCLYLNVYIPKDQPSKNDNFDVIVNIHGGGFMYGDGTLFGASYILDRNVVYISINYRLGLLGFLSTEDTIVPGNNGLKDQQLALIWVQKYIAYFGGNPKSVTLMGLSAGGASVHFHYFSPQSKGLFHKAISQSGTALMPWAITEDALQKTKKLASLLNCQNSNIKNIINCLKKVPVDELVAKTQYIYGFKRFPITPFGPVVEVDSKSSFLAKHPYKQLEDGEITDAPWLTWVTKDEGMLGASFLLDSLEEVNTRWDELSEYIFDYESTAAENNKKDIAQKIKSFYFENDMISESNVGSLLKAIGDRYFYVAFDTAVQMQAKVSKSRVYAGMYSFDKTTMAFSDLKQLKLEGVCHGADAFVLHDSTMFPFYGKKFTKSEKYIKDLLLDFISSFAKDGQPKAGKIVWERINQTSNYLFIRDEDDVKFVETDNISNKDFWESLNLLENGKTIEIRDEL